MSTSPERPLQGLPSASPAGEVAGGAGRASGAAAAPAGPAGPSASDRLLARAHPEGYLDTWAQSLTRALVEGVASEERAAAVFRLGEDLYALDVAHVREVHRPGRVHRVPGRSNEIFRGLVSLRGELVLCADLHAMLGAERPPRTLPTARILRVANAEGAWAFEVDELLDVHRYALAQVAPPQVTVSKAAVHFTDGLLVLGERSAARLDAERFFGGLARSLQ
ncbi:MAG: chemotaxis protein CheW [Planctomycetia bacterium]